jgi:hypothetical protein
LANELFVDYFDRRCLSRGILSPVRLPLDQPEKLTGSFPEGQLVAFRMSLEPLVVGRPIIAAFAAATSATIKRWCHTYEAQFSGTEPD